MRNPALSGITFGAVVLLGMAALANSVRGQVSQGAAANPSFGPLIVRPLKGGVYWTQGGTGGNNCNTGFIVGDNGVIVVDAKLNPASAQAMLTEIAKITPRPVTHVILTHSDGDHTNGLPAFPKGITIVAHQNAEKEMEAAIKVGGQGAPAPEYMPTRVVTKNDEVLTIDGVRLNLIHVAPAHTSGDLAVFLPDQKILFTGDIMATTRPEPLVHREKGGTSGGFVDFYRALIALDVDTIVTGHGELVTKADLQKRMTEVQEKKAKITAMVAIRVRDLLRAIDFASQFGRIRLAGSDMGALWALFAAVVDHRVTRVAIRRGLASYRMLTDHGRFMQAASQIVPGILKRFDLPQLAELVAPRPLAILDPTDHLKNVIDPRTAGQIYEATRTAYRTLSAADDFRLGFKEELASHIGRV